MCHFNYILGECVNVGFNSSYVVGDLCLMDEISVFLLCGALVLPSFIYIYTSKNVRMKRILVPFAYSFAAVPLLNQSIRSSSETLESALTIALIIGAAIFSMFSTKYCVRCGATYFTGNLAERQRECKSCGAELT